MVRRPENIADHAEQLREPIVKSTGYTPTERHLAKLAARTFLEMWSYPSPFRDQPGAGITDGKEICDLLVVCDPHVIIFSEKKISWTNKPTDVAWPRWFRKAVLEATAQLRGAERWINEHPDRIFLDHGCTTPFPLKLPPLDRRQVHRVVVARGASAACREYFNGGTGSLVVRPDIAGPLHYSPKLPNYAPFAVGDIDPASDFVHVFDDTSLDVIMGELDTISDFVDYLDKRAAFIRSGNLAVAHGEEDLLAYYAVRINSNGDHDFTPPGGKSWRDTGPVIIDGDEYQRFINEPQYIARKQANKPSYFWDGLIENFTTHMLGGTSIVLPGFQYELSQSELAVRHMALANRFLRRNLGRAVIGALEIGQKKDVFFRAMLGAENSKGSETGFFILTLKYLKWMDAKGGYDKYRSFRTSYLEIYAKSLLMKHPYLERVIGIAMEPPNQKRGSSEDCAHAEQRAWSDEDIRQVREDCERLGIMRSLKETRPQEAEFPELKISKMQRGYPGSGNRKQRRAEAAGRKH
jgi:hypothetical protein